MLCGPPTNCGVRISTVITRLGENITQLTDADDVTTHYEDVLQTIAALRLETQISVKLTQLGLDVDPLRCHANLVRLAERAQQSNNFVWIDMEYSSYVERTIAAFTQARSQRANVGLCVQAYLHRTPDDLEKLLRATTAIRLVKGAYREAPEVAIQSKKEVDAAYMRLATDSSKKLPPVGSRVPRFATHDLPMLRRITGLARDLGIANDAFEIQMLYGFNARSSCGWRGGLPRPRADQLRLRLVSWYMRRLAERPANVMFLLRNLVG
jgi:proline dehydrogenase